MSDDDPGNAGVYIALGSNLGNRELNLGSGLSSLCRDGGIRLLRVSRFHETEPEGGPAGQPRFLNAAAEVETALPPAELLAQMLAVEVELGRIRLPQYIGRTDELERNGPRTLDLDLLIYRDLVINEPGLQVPHPRMWDRSFVLVPLAEIADVEWLRQRVGPQRCR